MSIQSFALNRCASTFSSDLPANTSLKCDQFKGSTGPGCTGGIGDTIGYTGCTTLCPASSGCCGGTKGGLFL